MVFTISLVCFLTLKETKKKENKKNKRVSKKDKEIKRDGVTLFISSGS